MRTPRLIYLFVPIVLACILVPAFLSDLFWKTLGTEIPLTVIFVLSGVLAFFLVRWMNRSSLFEDVEGSDRSGCRVALVAASLLLPTSFVVGLNSAFLQEPVYTQAAMVTGKSAGAGKAGGVQYYVAFKGAEISELGGIRVTAALYGSVQPGSKVVIYLKTGRLGFPVAVGMAKG